MMSVRCDIWRLPGWGQLAQKDYRSDLSICLIRKRIMIKNVRTPSLPKDETTPIHKMTPMRLLVLLVMIMK